MRFVPVFIIAFIFSSCSDPQSKVNNTHAYSTPVKRDSLKAGAEEEVSIYLDNGDTSITFNGISYNISWVHESLNDSAIVHSYTYTDKGKIFEETNYDHNHESVIAISTNDVSKEIEVRKERFSDSLATDFMQECILRSPGFIRFDAEQKELVFVSSLGVPETCWNYRVEWSVGLDGTFKFIRVEDTTPSEEM